MLAKFMTAGVVGSALLATVAFAQTPAATTDKTASGAGRRRVGYLVPGQLARIETGRPQRL